MNNLLKFYIPKTLTSILQIFVVSLCFVAVIHFMPFSNELKMIITMFMIFLVFPLASYFNNHTYIPTSLGWILLTPNKKSNIVLVHGLLNIFKIISTLLLGLFFLFLYDKSLFSKIFLDRVAIGGSQIFTRLSVNDLIGWLTVICFLAALVFGILPNYIQTMQQRQNHHVQKTTKEKIKAYILILIFGSFGLMFIPTASDVYDKIPLFIKVSFFFVIFILVVINSTLKSLRLYFSHKKLKIISLAMVLFLSSFFYLHATNDVKSTNLHVKDKMESLDYLGVYNDGLEKRVVDELLLAGPSLTLLTESEVKDFLITGTRREMHQSVLSRWGEICRERHDFTCRLAYDLMPKGESKDMLYEEVKQSCPNDVASCILISKNKGITTEESKVVSAKIIEKCTNNQNEFEKVLCRKYIAKMKNEKK